MIRVGQGFDTHAFEANRRLILGGVFFSGETGLAGHSDGDALTHAVIDALLGAAALGDIGTHFPSSDETLRESDSIALLKQVAKLVTAAGYGVINVDATVIAQRPRVSSHISEMRHKLALAIGIDIGRVSVKATTTDELGAIGKGEGIAAQAIALIEAV